MQTKLTLSLDQQVIERAKAYAKKRGTSLSKLVQELLMEKTEALNEKEVEIPEEFKGVFASVKLPEDFDYKKEKTKYLREKYG